MMDQLISLKPSTEIDVAAKQVVRLLAQSSTEPAGFKLKIGPYAGVHLVVPFIPRSAEFIIEVATEAQLTFSLLGIFNSSHKINLKIDLVGNGAKALIQQAVIGQKLGQAEFDFTLKHIAPGTRGRIVSRRIQLDETKGFFKCLLAVNKNAQNTDTYLSDKALLLGEKSQATSDPQLEILADQVKASHGATIGHLPFLDLFYLRCRGLPLTIAESLLLEAFLKPALIGVQLKLVQDLIHDLSTRPNAKGGVSGIHSSP